MALLGHGVLVFDLMLLSELLERAVLEGLLEVHCFLL